MPLAPKPDVIPKNLADADHESAVKPIFFTIGPQRS